MSQLVVSDFVFAASFESSKCAAQSTAEHDQRAFRTFVADGRGASGTAVVGGTLMSFAASAQGASPVGDWALVSLTIVNADTGETTRPWGASPVGQLTYSANGRMIAVLTADPKSRKPVDPTSDKANEQRAELYLSSSAYSGTWSAVGNTVIHKVDIALDASWVGTDQVRYLRGLDKDNLTIETAPILGTDGKTKYKVTLIWKRIK